MNIDTTSWDKKEFLVQDSIKSMATYHARYNYMNRGQRQYQLRIADCNNTVKLWGDLDNPMDLKDGIEKMDQLIKAATEIKVRLETEQFFRK